MALNPQTFKTRSLTAVIFVVVMMAGLLLNRWSFFLLFSIVHFGCWLEYQRLVEKFNPDYATISPFHRYGIMVGGWCLMLFFTNNELRLMGIRLSEAGFWLGSVFLVLFPLGLLLQSRKFLFRNLGYSVSGLLYISLSLALLIDLRNHWIEENYQLNLVIPLLIIFTLWVNDTMAYLVGSLIGKTPFSPISPKKTWEGTVGGILLAVAVMTLLAYLTGKLPLVHTAIMAFLISVCGTYGDLFESKLKRLAGVKDSGHIMPGHGGFLDRFDSLLFAATITWLYVQFVLAEAPIP